MTRKTRLNINRFLALFLVVIMVSSSFILVTPDNLQLEDNENQPYLGSNSSNVISDVTPPEPIWTHVYNGLPSSDNKFESVTQLDNGDIAATGGQMASHAAQPECWDWFTLSDSNPEVGSSDGQDWTEYYGWSDYERALSITAIPGTSDVVSAGYFMGNGRDIRVRRLDSSGTEVWTKLFSEPYDQIGYQVIPCSGGGFAVTGRYQNGSGWPYDFVLIRLTDGGYESWRKGYGGSGSEEAYSVAECSNGDFVITGFTTTYGGADKDLWVVRVDSSGNEVWNQYYGGDFDDWGRSIIECENGDFAITGSTKSNGGSDEDLWIVRLNSTGHLLWDKYYGGGNPDTGMELVECTGGGLAIAGTTQSYGNGGQDIWLVRTNSTGHILWSNEYGGSYDDTGNSIIKAQDGGFIIAGGSHNWGGVDEDAYLLKVADPPVWLKDPVDQTIRFGDVFSYQLEATATYLDTWWLNDTYRFSIDTNGKITTDFAIPEGEYGVQVWVNDTLGNTLSGSFKVVVDFVPYSDTIVWQRLFGGTNDDFGYDIIRLGDGGYGIAGYGNSFGAGQHDGWLARCDEYGNLLWNHTYGDATMNTFTSIDECSNGDFVAAGTTVDQSNGIQAWVIRTDSMGGLLWEGDFGGLYTDNATSVIESSDEGIVVAGYSTTASLDKELWIFRLNSTGHLNWSTIVTLAYHQEGLGLIEWSAGGYVVAGYTDAGAAITTRDGLIYAVNLDGSYNWSYTYANTQNELWGLVECTNGDIAATGYRDVGGLSYEVLFVRVNSLGVFQYANVYGGSTYAEYGTSIVQKRSGGFVILGNTWTSGSSLDVYLFTISFTGTFQWSTMYGGDEYDRGLSILECSDGGYTIVGYTKSMGAGGSDIWLYRAQAIRWVDLPEDQTIEFGEELGYPLTIEILEGTLGTWAVNDTGNFGLIVSGNATLINDTKIAVGTYPVSIDVTTDFGEFLNLTITVTVTHPLPPEWIETPENQYVELGDAFEYDLDAFDVAGIDTWYLNNTIDFSINQLGIIRNETNLPVGICGLEVNVNDTLGNLTIASFDVHVEDTIAPTLNITPIDWFIEYDTYFNYTIGGCDLSGIDTWWLNDTTDFMVDENGSIYEKHTLPVTIHKLRLSVNDTEGNIRNADFRVTVSIDPPIWLVEPSIVYSEYTQDFRYVPIVTSDAGIESWKIDDTSNFAIDEYGIISNATPLDIGTYPVTVTVTDIWNQSSGVVFDVIVRDTTAPYWIIPPQNVTIEYNDFLVIELVVSDPSGVSHWSINNTDLFGITSIGRVVNVSVINPGLYWLTVSVYDIYDNSRSVVFSLNVTETQVPQWIQTPEDQYMELGSELLYELEAYDVSGIAEWIISDPITFDITDDGIITNALPLSLGTYELEITVIDGVGNSVTVMIDVIVQDTTPPTWIYAPVNLGVQYGESVSAQFAAWDLSGIGMWTVDDTVQFRINAIGFLESTDDLRTGVHYLNISVFDTHGNVRSSVITVIVQAVEAGGPDISLAFAFVGVITGSVVAIMSIAFCIVRRHSAGEDE